MTKVFQSVEMAKRILENPKNYDKPIIDVALDSGFYEVKKFNVEFRRATNMCPIEYRAFHIKFREVTGMSPQEYIKKHGNASKAKCISKTG